MKPALEGDGERVGTGVSARLRTASGRESEKAVLGAVVSALRNIEYGSVLIKIHQGEVVGIETSTKVRFKST